MSGEFVLDPTLSPPSPIHHELIIVLEPRLQTTLRFDYKMSRSHQGRADVK